jgi:hypothetical protein
LPDWLLNNLNLSYVLAQLLSFLKRASYVTTNMAARRPGSLPSLDSKNLKPWQARIIGIPVHRALGYLSRLQARMEQRG